MKSLDWFTKYNCKEEILSFLSDFVSPRVINFFLSDMLKSAQQLCCANKMAHVQFSFNALGLHNSIAQFDFVS